MILILFKIPCSFKNCQEFFGCLQIQTTCLRIEVKPERSRKLCHIFSHRTRHNEVKYFQKEHSCYHSPMFSFNWSKQWWVEEKTTLCNERQNEIAMNWISMLRLVWHKQGYGQIWLLIILPDELSACKVVWLLQLVIIYHNIVAWMNVSRNYRCNRNLY